MHIRHLFQLKRTGLQLKGASVQVLQLMLIFFLLRVLLHVALSRIDRKSTRLNSSHTVIYTLSLHDALPISQEDRSPAQGGQCPGPPTHAHLLPSPGPPPRRPQSYRSEEHTSELQSHSDLHSFPTRRSSDLSRGPVSSSRGPVSRSSNSCSSSSFSGSSSTSPSVVYERSFVSRRSTISNGFSRSVFCELFNVSVVPVMARFKSIIVRPP